MIVLPFLRFVVLHSFRPARPLMRRLIVLLELIVLILNSQERYKNPRGLCCCCPLGLHWEDESEMQYLYKRFEKSGTDSQRRAGQCPLLGTCFDPPSHCTCGFCTILLANIITIIWLFFQAYLLCIIIFLFIVFFFCISPLSNVSLCLVSFFVFVWIFAWSVSLFLPFLWTLHPLTNYTTLLLI